MNLATYYSGPARFHTLDDDLWPADLEQQARVAIGAWLGQIPPRWTGAITSVERVGDRVKVNVVGTDTFDFVATNIGGPW